jgi:hypothetical protein
MMSQLDPDSIRQTAGSSDWEANPSS